MPYRGGAHQALICPQNRGKSTFFAALGAGLWTLVGLAHMQGFGPQPHIPGGSRTNEKVGRVIS